MRNSDDSDQYDMFDHEERVTMPKKKKAPENGKEKSPEDEGKLAKTKNTKKLSQNQEKSQNA